MLKCHHLCFGICGRFVVIVSLLVSKHFICHVAESKHHLSVVCFGYHMCLCFHMYLTVSHRVFVYVADWLCVCVCVCASVLHICPSKHQTRPPKGWVMMWAADQGQFWTDWSCFFFPRGCRLNCSVSPLVSLKHPRPCHFPSFSSCFSPARPLPTL